MITNEEPRRKKYTISLSDDEADVLDAIVCLNGYTGRSGAWIGDQVRVLVAQRKNDTDVQALVAARTAYQQSEPKQRPQGRMTRHGFGVIDGGVAL